MTGPVHHLRAVTYEAGARQVSVACQPDPIRADRGTAMADVAAGWASAVTCEACRAATRIRDRRQPD